MLAKICTKLGADAIDILPFAHDQLATLAWDIPEAVCAVAFKACEIDCCNTLNIPEQVHISFSEAGMDTMRVAWTTLSTDSPSSSTVNWWVQNTTGQTQTATGSNSTYTQGGWRGVLHTALMSDLQAGTTYEYRVGDPTSAVWSRTFAFRTLPANAGRDASRPLRFAQIGDMGYANKSDETIARLSALIDADQIDFILHTGDVGYADGYMRHWDVFQRKIESIAATVPYMTGPGNHEIWYNFTAYKSRWFMPSYTTQKSMYWSLNLGPLHLAMLNTESPLDYPMMKPFQLDWLMADLAAANAHRDPAANPSTPWIITAGHRPFYCADGGRQCELFAEILRGAGESILVGNKVDLVVQSHMHNMQRSYPIGLNGTVTTTNYTKPGAPVYVVSGAGGNRESNPLPKDQPWLAFKSQEIGFALVDIVGARSVGSSSLRFRFVASNDSRVLDEFTIVK